MFEAGFLAHSSTQTVLTQVTSDFYFFQSVSPFSGLHLCGLSMTSKGILSVLDSDHGTICHTSYLTHQQPMLSCPIWGEKSTGIHSSAVVQEAVNNQVLTYPLLARQEVLFKCLVAPPSISPTQLSQPCLCPSQPHFSQTPAQLLFPPSGL